MGIWLHLMIQERKEQSMKSEKLRILQQHKIRVPQFITTKEKIDLSFTESGFFAVRSDFDIEDSKRSFAGQFQTLLNVKREDVFEAVKKVKDSMNQKNVEEYRRLNHVAEKGKANVIIQEMIEAEYSGVLFTANPKGILNEMVIVVGKGTGNKIVNDEANTTTYYYNKADNLYYYDNDYICLRESCIKELVYLGTKIEEIFKDKMDIEFAIQNNKIYILQARKITTLKNDKVIVLDNSNIVESYPGVVLPLTQSFVKEIYYKIFQSCIRNTTKSERITKKLDSSLKDMVEACNGRMYYRISNWYDILTVLPFSGKIIPIWQEMLGIEDKSVDTNQLKFAPLEKGKIAIEFCKRLKNNKKEMKELNQFFRKSFPKMEKKLENTEDIHDLIVLFEKMKSIIIQKWDITLINDMYTFLYTFLAKKVTKEDIADMNLVSMKLVEAMNHLNYIGWKYGLEDNRYKEKAKKYILLYGDRCVGELKLETKTYRTNPELLNIYVAEHLEEKYRKIENNKSVCKTFIGKNAKIGIQNREISRLNRTRLFGYTRAIMRKIGCQLVEQGKLTDVGDIFYLYLDEIKNHENFIYKELVEERKVEYKHYRRIPEYSRLVFDGKIVDKTPESSINSHIMDKKLIGLGTSEGTVRGEVIVIEDGDLEKQINVKDKIIVTKRTDPGWIFLIKDAKGIIAENGSLLSHTAIVSRELKKPAIVNIKNATRILKNGTIVEMDATKGIVKIT